LASGSSLLALAVKKKTAETDSARLVSAKNSLFSYSGFNGGASRAGGGLHLPFLIHRISAAGLLFIYMMKH
ncbi:MAG: hypothetical protein LRY50_11370, partial [Geovibrio sp.]|nr:hypothetical protein [Geovibrio sp.]